MELPRYFSLGPMSKNIVAFFLLLGAGLLVLTEVLWNERSMHGSQQRGSSMASGYNDSSKIRSSSSLLISKTQFSDGGHNHPFALQYQSSAAENYVFDNAKELGYDIDNRSVVLSRRVCDLWTIESSSLTTNLTQYRSELAIYTALVKNFSGVSDLRKLLQQGMSKDEVCRQVQLHPGGLTEIFKSGQLSTGPFGFVEPLLPPLRHPEFCFSHKHLLDLNYIVHDFSAMCRALTPNSRIVLVDMGASLMFHGGADSPAVYLTHIYRKFGLPFDHIYAFEITPTAPTAVFERVPPELLTSYHWINVGVSANPEDRLNPFRMLLSDFTEDDFIVVKLDIDTPFIELPLAYQLLNDTRLHKLIDHFYFEHHVNLGDLLPWWGTKVNGTVFDSLQLFRGLRERGVASHSWV